MRDTLVAVAAAIDHLSNARRRAITQQMHGEAVRFAETRIVELGEERVKVSVAGGLDGPVTVTLGADGKAKPKAITLARPGGSANPSGKARSTARRSRCRCARS